VIPVSKDVLIASAELRAKTGLPLPDAIHAVTAIETGCASIVSNDRSFRVVAELRLSLLSELED